MLDSQDCDVLLFVPCVDVREKCLHLHFPLLVGEDVDGDILAYERALLVVGRFPQPESAGNDVVVSDDVRELSPYLEERATSATVDIDLDDRIQHRVNLDAVFVGVRLRPVEKQDEDDERNQSDVERFLQFLHFISPSIQ